MRRRNARPPAPAAFRFDRRPIWRRWFPAIVTLLLLAAAPLLSHAQAGPDSVSLGWTAPGDDSLVGTATVYDLRLATAPISLSTWDSATPVSGLPAPLPAGSTQRVTVRGLSQGTVYWFAIRTQDDAGNWSGLSNVVRWDWTLDTAPPAAPSGLVAARQGLGVSLDWSPGTEPDLEGYHVYRASAEGGPFERLTSAVLSSPAYVDASVPGGVPSWWYAVTAQDAAGNESARSASAVVSFAVAPPAASIEPAYPNPSRLGEVVRIPVDAPAGAAAVLEIVDAAGRRVRRLDLAPAGGAQEAQWDGRNDAGRETAPGVYRAWLLAGDSRSCVRVVRVP